MSRSSTEEDCSTGSTDQNPMEMDPPSADYAYNSAMKNKCKFGEELEKEVPKDLDAQNEEIKSLNQDLKGLKRKLNDLEERIDTLRRHNEQLRLRMSNDRSQGSIDSGVGCID
ncbi:UNVERIFIED_CONTAM: hypothetical protein RMT77_015764 [Armadillidium vulgare]